ncbi:MAG: DUF6320 domain-containing protein [Faecalibacterium sp.]
MKRCPHCRIQVGGTPEYCPLCRNPLVGEPSAPLWPSTSPPLKRLTMVFKVAAFLLLGSTVVCAAVDFLLMQEPHRHWSGLVLGWALILLAVLYLQMRRHANGPKLLFQLLMAASALAVFTDWFFGWTGFSLDLIVPVLCSAALVLNFVFSFVHTRFTENALVYLLLNMIVGLFPYLLLPFQFGSGDRIRSLPWVICLIISALTFLGLVLFKGRTLRSELEKRLHL